MAQELERKILVSREEWERCREIMRRHTATEGDAYVQINYYFDTPAFDLAAAHTMLRVRGKRDGLKLQYKNKRTRTDDVLLCEESEVPLTALPRTVIPSEFFPSAPALPCVLLGELVTCRTDFIIPGAVVSLDENYYLGKVDFEIEVEGTREAIETSKAFLSPAPLCPVKGKFSRFLAEYRRYFEKGSL